MTAVLHPLSQRCLCCASDDEIEDAVAGLPHPRIVLVAVRECCPSCVCRWPADDEPKDVA